MQEAGMKAPSKAEPQVREQLNNQKGFLGEYDPRQPIKFDNKR